MQQQRTHEQQQPRPPQIQRQREQFPTLPPENADDQKRDQVAVSVVVLLAADVVEIEKPFEQRRRMDVAQNRVPPKLEQHRPGRQQREEKRLVRQPLPAFQRIRPPIRWRWFSLIFSHACVVQPSDSKMTEFAQTNSRRQRMAHSYYFMRIAFPGNFCPMFSGWIWH